MGSTSAAVEWLLASDEPAIRRLVRRDVLGEQPTEDVLDGPKVQALLSGQRADGGFGKKPYSKWSGAHWRLVSLVELEIPAGEPRAVAAADQVLRWLSPPTAGRRPWLTGWQGGAARSRGTR